MTVVEPSREGLAGATKDTKGKIVEFAWWLKKQGYAEKSTIPLYVGFIKRFSETCNIFNPDSIKAALVSLKGSNKSNGAKAYTLFLKMQGQTWQPPKVTVTRKLPFIPTEQEIDTLIASCGRKTAAFLQLLKETVMRSGEATRLKSANVDFQRQTITLNNPEKGSNPRIFKVSRKLIDMLNALKKRKSHIFSRTGKFAFYNSRKRTAKKLQNPRLMQIHFHTLRHWKATMLYHQTKDILYVKQFLGHRRIDNTLLYVQIADTIFKETAEEFTVRIAKTPKEIQSLLEVGFEYVCEKEGSLYFRKRKSRLCITAENFA